MLPTKRNKRQACSRCDWGSRDGNRWAQCNCKGTDERKSCGCKLEKREVVEEARTSLRMEEEEEESRQRELEEEGPDSLESLKKQCNPANISMLELLIFRAVR